MTPEEKAKALVYKFYQLRAYETMAEAGKRAAWNISKESALIAVDEIISELKRVDDKLYEYEGVRLGGDEYWQLVKNHIQSL